MWVSVRSRLYARSYAAIINYTLLLLLFGIAAVKHINVAFLTASLLPAELSTVAFLICKLRSLAGEAAAAGAACRSRGRSSSMMLCAVAGAACRIRGSMQEQGQHAGAGAGAAA